MYSRISYEAKVKPIFAERWAALRPTLNTTDAKELKGAEVTLRDKVTKEVFEAERPEVQGKVRQRVEEERRRRQAASVEVPTNQ